MREGHPVVLQDDHDREDEADLIVAAERLTPETMPLFIRECSGIVCLCLSDEKVRAKIRGGRSAHAGLCRRIDRNVRVVLLHVIVEVLAGEFVARRRRPHA